LALAIKLMTTSLNLLVASWLSLPSSYAFFVGTTGTLVVAHTRFTIDDVIKVHF